jgi:hypothetical protein
VVVIRKPALLVMLAACGRIDFAPRSGDGGGMVADTAPTFELIAHTIKNGNTANLVSDPIDTTGASLIVVAECDYDTGVPILPMDSQHNTTWVGLGRYGGDMMPSNIRIAYVIAPSTSTSHTFTNPGSDYLTIAVLAFSGTTTFDGSTGGSGATPLAAGSFSPAQIGELVVAFACSGDSLATAISIDGGFTLIDSIANDFATAPEDVASAYRVATTAVDPTWTFTGDMTVAASIAGFLHP